LRIYGRPKKERRCIEKCHAREKPLHEGSLLGKGIWVARSLNKSLETQGETPVTAAVRTQHRGEESEKNMQGLIETPED